MFRQLASLTVTLAALATAVRADSYLWAGANGDFGNPASWAGTAPSAPGSPSQQLIFPLANSPYTATVDTPWTINSLAFTSVGGVTIAASPGAGFFFDGPNPIISQTDETTGNFATFSTPITAASDLTFSGSMTYTLTSTLASTANGVLALTNGATVVYQNSTAPTGFSQTILDNSANGGLLAWSIAAPDSNPLQLAFGSGPIFSSNGAFAIDLITQPKTTTVTATLSNPINVQGSLLLGGTTTPASAITIPRNALIAALPPTPPISSASFKFTGPISLGGQLLLSPYFGFEWQTSAQSTLFELSGDITLDQSNTNDLTLGTDGRIAALHTVISGNILDDPNPAHTGRKPLLLYNPGGYGPDSDFVIAGIHNTYSTGTILENGLVTLAPGATLGTGTISIWSGLLRLSAPSNLNPGQTILVGFDAGLSLNFDAFPYPFIDPASEGNLDLDTAFATPLDMSKLGNGQMFLGSSSNGTYEADSLLPAADHTYRINGSLTIAKSVLADYNGVPSSLFMEGGTLAAPNSYSGGSLVYGGIAAAPGALGTGDVSIGQYVGSGGLLELTAPSAYSATAKVDVFGTLLADGPNGSIPFSDTPPILHPGSALILGDNLTNNSDRFPDSMHIHLDNSTFILKGFGTTNEIVGPITITGAATVVLWNPAAGANVTTLAAPSLTRDGHSVLLLVPFLDPGTSDVGNFLPFTPANGNSANFKLAAAPLTINGMVVPWIQARMTFYDFLNMRAAYIPAPSFLTYSADGFALATYTAMPANAGTSTEIVDVPSSGGDLLVSGDKSINALRAYASILSNNAVPPTLHIASGGLIGGGQIPFSMATVTIQPNIDFGNAEACVNVQGGTADFDSQVLEITGVVTANSGLTKFGTGLLRLSNPVTQIQGPLTILEGGLELAALPEPSSADPVQIALGSSLNFLNSTGLSRPVAIVAGTPATGYPYITSILTAPGTTLTLAAPITGQDPLTIGENYPFSGTLRVAAPINYNGSLTLASDHIDLIAPISALSLGFSLNPQSKITGSAVISTHYGFPLGQGIIAPGEDPGDLASMTFDVPTLSLFGEASLLIDLDATGHSDRILITGALDIDDPNYGGGSTTLALNILGTPTSQIYTIVSASEIDGTFDTVTGLPAGYAVEYTPSAILIAPSSSSNEAAVPEPSALGVFLAGGCTLLLLRRSQRTAAPKAH